MAGSASTPAAAAHAEGAHLSSRSNWLRAAVLGANDGILSVSGLLLGVVGAGADRNAIVTAGVAGVVAGALSMAAGEYVSVSSQRDSERADLNLERRELRTDPEGELHELVEIYRERGLDDALAQQVAEQLTKTDALGAHARDELGLSDTLRARPLQAAGSSAVSFTAGAALPLAAALIAPPGSRAIAIVVVTLIALAVLGLTGARLGGAPVRPAMLRVLTWGALAMAVTYAIGAAVGTAV